MCDVSERFDDRENNWDLKGMVTAKEVATSSIESILREVQRIRRCSSKAETMTIIQLINIAREACKTKSENAKLFKQNMDVQAKLVQTPAAESTMCSQPEVAERSIIAFKEQLTSAMAALKNVGW